MYRSGLKAAAVDDVTQQLSELRVQDTPLLKSNYLYLPDLKGENSSYVVSMPPMNSSGDIYHVLSYVFLVRAEEKRMPNIILTYDGGDTLQTDESKMNTYSQVMRSLDFVSALGQRDVFSVAHIDTANCQRENNRQAVLEGYLSNLEFCAHYIDQKLLTTLIAHYIVERGRDVTTNILRAGFMNRDKEFIPPEMNQEIIAVAKKEIDKIKKHIGKSQLIILHFRYSSKANNKQNMQSTYLLTRIQAYLESKKYKIWFIFADGRKLQSFSGIGSEHRTDVFPLLIKDKDYGKLYHLQLLDDLYALPNLYGMIGNTSGTLDVAAFLGHNVYNMHHFDAGMNYQAYRILIQTAFISVDFFREEVFEAALKVEKKEEKVCDEHLPNLGLWLEREKETACLFPKIAANLTKIDTAQSGYAGLFFVKNMKKNGAMSRPPCLEDMVNDINKRAIP